MALLFLVFLFLIFFWLINLFIYFHLTYTSRKPTLSCSSQTIYSLSLFPFSLNNISLLHSPHSWPIHAVLHIAVTFHTFWITPSHSNNFLVLPHICKHLHILPVSNSHCQTLPVTLRHILHSRSVSHSRVSWCEAMTHLNTCQSSALQASHNVASAFISYRRTQLDR